MTTAATADAAAIDVGATEDSRDVAAARVIRHNVYWSMGAGVIPFAFLDTAAALGVQLKMLKELGDVYDVPFSANAGKSAVTALLASVTGGFVGHKVLGTAALRTLARRTPVIGTIVGLATMPAFYAAFTYAVGKVFNKHFASGGTFLSFNAKEKEAEFKEAFEEGKAKASDKVAADKPATGKTAA